MATLEMKADGPYSFNPGHYSSRDINLYANCNMRLLNNDTQNTQNEHYYTGILSASLNQPLASTKILKQTMIRHESIFQDQICQLHRLYNRQRELMNEIKYNSNQHHLRLETVQPNLLFTEASSECWLNQGCCNLSASGAVNGLSKLSRFEGKIKQEASNSTPLGSSIRVSDSVGSKLKKVGKKILDLELPAAEYIDSEEEEPLLGGKFSAEPAFPSLHQNRTFKSLHDSYAEQYPRRIDLNVVVKEESTSITSFFEETKGFVDLNEPPMLEEETDPYSHIRADHISGNDRMSCSDLSERTMSDFQVQQEDDIQKIQEAEVHEIHSNDLRQDMDEDQHDCLSNEHESGKSSSDLVETSSISVEGADIEQAVEISASEVSDQASGKLQISSKNFDLESLGSNCSANSYRGQTSEKRKKSNLVVHQADRSSGESSQKKRRQDFMRGILIVQALPCSDANMAKFKRHGVAGDKSPHSKKLKFVPQVCSASDHSTFHNSDDEFVSEPDCVKGKKVLKDNNAVCAEKFGLLDTHLDCRSVLESGGLLPASELVAKRLDGKPSGFRYPIKKNLCTNKEESMPTSSRTSEAGIDGPANNLENKDRSTLRGEANENQIETNVRLSGLESEVLLEELVREAAEAIVTISTAVVQTHAENVYLKQPVRSWQTGSLHWFSTIVASVVDDLKSEFGVVLSSQLGDHQDDYLSDGVDYFEIMTLKLEEVKEGEHCYKANFQQVEALCHASMPSQPRKGRTRRGRQHRKDFQREVLPTFTSVSRHKVTKDLQAIGGLIEANRTRRNSLRTNGWTEVMGSRRKRQIPAASTNVDRVGHGLSELQTMHSKADIEDWSIGWGNITRRRRKMRIPASNTRLIFGQV